MSTAAHARLTRRDHAPMAVSMDGTHCAVSRNAGAVDLNRRSPEVHCSRYIEVQPTYKRFRRWVRRVFA